MHKIRPFFLLAIIFLSFQAVPVAAIKTDSDVLRDLNLDSKSIILIDTDRQKTILAKNSDQQMPVASLTKIMTALVALEKRKLDETVSISRDMISDLRDYVTIGLQTGQQVTVEDLLYATLLPSAGDAAQALAISTGGSISGFAEMMNQKAAELKLKNTHFSNPVGMNENNYSTAEDFGICFNILRDVMSVVDFFIMSWLPTVILMSLNISENFSKREMTLQMVLSPMVALLSNTSPQWTRMSFSPTSFSIRGMRVFSK